MKTRSAQSRKKVEATAGITYLLASIHLGGAATDARAIVRLRETPLNCKSSQLSRYLCPEVSFLHLCCWGIGAMLKPAVAVGGMDWEMVEEA